MKSQLFAGNSEQTTNSTAGTCVAGGPACELGTSPNSGGIGKMRPVPQVSHPLRDLGMFLLLPGVSRVM